MDFHKVKTFVWVLLALTFVHCSRSKTERGAGWITGVHKNVEGFLSADQSDPIKDICAGTIPKGSKVVCEADHSKATLTFEGPYPYSDLEYRGYMEENLTCSDGALWEGGIVNGLVVTITVTGSGSSKTVSINYESDGSLFTLPENAKQMLLAGKFTFAQQNSTSFAYSCKEAANSGTGQPSEGTTTPVPCTEWVTAFESMSSCTRSSPK